jgi:signal transduction histidine kinase
LDDRFGTLTDEENNDLSNERKLENQLAKRISWFLHADITTLYRYDYGKESLETLGVYCGTSQRDEWIQQVPAQMKQIHIDPDKREKSICYRCVDTEEIRFCRNFDSDHPENTEPQNETLLSPEQLDSHKSGLAVPMLVHNRVWGVVEILGTRPHQFRWDDRRFVSELGETLSPFFYHQWLLKKLQQLNKIAVNEKETPEGYDKICQCLAELLMSYGAAIWVYESQAGGYYKCKGVYQRQWNQQPSLRDEKIYLSDKESVIIYTREEVRQHPEKVWWEKHLDELPPQWKDLQRNHPLIEKGIKSIACIPIYSSQQQEHQETIAYIVLYNKADRKYDERWKHYFGFVARYTAIVLEAIQAQTVLERRSRRFVRHEIKSNVNQISDRVSELKRFYQKDFHERQSHISKDFLRRYDLLIGDLETYARYLQDDVEYLAEKNFVKYMQSESPIAAHIQDKIASGEQPSWLDLRQAFNVNFRAAWILQKKKQLTGIYTSHRPFTGIHTSHRPFTSIYTSHRSLYVRIHEYSLHHILGNLCDNAIKYATEGSTIRIGETEIDGSLEWSISNVGECLGEHEQDRIFEEEARGSNAKNEGGEGKGLFIVRGVCELYGIAVRYDTEPAAKGNCLHKFTLSFPPQMIKAT